ncbi:TPA: helix-turn-helix domain-containing protein [Corynebacterium striatum]|nr:helix-turn-helix domain-containing protein [Corynebacterium striatum]
MCPMTSPVLIGTKEAADLLGITRAQVNRRVLAGKLTPLGEFGERGIRVFDRAAIEALAEKEQAK